MYVCCLTATAALCINLSISNLIFTTGVSNVSFFNFLSISAAAVTVVVVVASQAFMLTENCTNKP